MCAKIFLADDERPVLEGISAAIKKRIPDLEICGYAETGQEAIEMAKLEQPDVILMDVRMPGISGLDALRELKKSNPETVPILLTAYERFDVAKEAFGLGVFDYLVKPVDQDMLISTINAAIMQAIAIKEESKRTRNALDKLAEARPLLEDGLIKSAINASDCLTNLIAYNDVLNFNPQKARMGAFIKKASAKEITDIIQKRKDQETIRSKLSYRIDCAVGTEVAGIIPVYFPLTEKTKDSNIIEETISAFDGFEYALGKIVDLKDINNSWQDALTLLSQKQIENKYFQFSEQQIIDDCMSCAMESNPPETIKKWNILNKDGYLKAVVAGAICWNNRKDPSFLLSVAQELNSLSIPYTAFEIKQNWGAGTSTRANEAVNYIKEHYSEQISLEDVAKYIGLSPTHLSRVLSLETGKSFIEHLSDIRLEKAKTELLSGQKSVKEICAIVGYSDPNYFSRVFKHATGISPSEFVKTNGKIQ